MFHIGILQLTQNLDDAVRGFKKGLQDLNIAAEFHYLNVDGNLSELPKAAQKLADLSPDLIFACSTPAAQAVKHLKTPIPALFTPVFDPVAANLVQSMQRPGENLTGMSGMVSAAEKISFIHELLPRAKSIGLLYDKNDPNSFIEKNHILKAAGDLQITELPFGRKEDLSLLGEKLPPSLDALFLPIGKTVEENFSSIAYYTDALNIPIVASHAPNVPMGALGALCASHENLGKACAEKARAILIDKIPAEQIPVGIAESPEILLNSFAAENLGISLPEPLVKKAKEIYV